MRINKSSLILISGIFIRIICAQYQLYLKNEKVFRSAGFAF